MCGIVGYVGDERKTKSVLIEGIKRLEYRGYDSAGVALLEAETEEPVVIRKVGRVDNLSNACKKALKEGFHAVNGIAHTRWATHGRVTDENAHPHRSSDGKIILAHNGVIENYESIRKFLTTKRYTFSSETDTEVLANLIAYHYQKEPESENGLSRFAKSVRKTFNHVEGTYGVAVICTDYPDRLVGARKGSPLILGVGKDECLLASDVSAVIANTNNVVYLNDGELVEITKDGYHISNWDYTQIEPVIHTVDWDIEDAEKSGFDHYMLKEIFEQPKSLENAMRGRFSEDASTAKFGGLNIDVSQLRQMDRILLLACGTAWHAALVIEYLIEKYARIPVEVEYASEFRYRNAPLDKNTLVGVISQSGETLDTLEALREAKRKGYHTMAITNGVGSSIARECHGGIYQHAGPEIGVASTKAFTSQVLIGAMFALYLARLRDMSYGEGKSIVAELKKVPDLVHQSLSEAEKIKEIAKRYSQYPDFLFLGRQSLFPIALEGALKLKEISYIHAEGYPAAEMKHGPIALVCEDCPSVFIVESDEIQNKVVANMQEVKARGGKVICIQSEDCTIPDGLADEVITLPKVHSMIAPLLATIPMQLLSYHIAIERDCDVDKPRNLAKSVTVE
ncbi:MAG: glutamine--fructose-6-phosphate transaminase (isomerizing) [Opitutales bacterium]|nr:glutamine--fructose-6-phosphate transaminase (isomerizing) [Opitutales bacterium]